MITNNCLILIASDYRFRDISVLHCDKQESTKVLYYYQSVEYFTVIESVFEIKSLLYQMTRKTAAEILNSHLEQDWIRSGSIRLSRTNLHSKSSVAFGKTLTTIKSGSIKSYRAAANDNNTGFSEPYQPGYDTLNIERNSTYHSTIPLNQSQIDVGMEDTTINPYIPLLNEAKQQNKCIILTQPDHFDTNHLHGPSFELVDPPSCFADVGPEFDQKVY